MKVFVYLRKSRAEENDPDALSKHRQRLEEYAQEQHFEIIKIFEEIVSGENLYLRPQMLALLAAVSEAYGEEIDGVLCMDIDRLGRGDMTSQGIIFETLKRHNIRIITPLRQYDLNNELDETYSEFEAFMARQEYRMIRRRMVRGTMQAIAQGGHMGEVPFGYQRIRDGKRSTLCPHPQNAAILKQIFLLYGEHQWGMQAIADWLNHTGVPPKKGMEWNRGTIGKILRNPVYTGKIVYGRRKTLKPRTKEEPTRYLLREESQWIIQENCHPALIDQEFFDRISRQLCQRTHPSTAGFQRQNPYSGLVFCTICGKKMQRQNQRTKGIYERLRCPTAGCSRSVSIEAFETALMQALKPTLSRWKCIETKEQTENKTLLPLLFQEYETLQKQKKRICEFLEQGVYSADFFRQRSEELEYRETALKNEIARAQKAAETDTAALAGKTLYELLLSEKDPVRKNTILRCFISHIDYDCPHPQNGPSHRGAPFTLRVFLRGGFL